MLNFGVVGSGWITDEYIHGAKDSGLWQLSAVYSRTKERGDDYAKKHGAEYVFTDIDKMAKSDKIDAVYIASPNYLHMEQAKVFIENGKHVICEKPLSAQADKLKENIALAREKGVIFLEAIMYMPLPQRELLEESLKKIGCLNLVKIDFCQRSSKLDAYLAGTEIPNIFNPKLETGALMDLGVYCIYPVLHLFGKPQEFLGGAQLLPTGADSSGGILMKYPDLLVNIVYSKIGQAYAGSEFQGTEGTLYVDSISRLADMSLRYKDGKTEKLLGDEEKFKLMGYEAKSFYRLITDFEANKAFYEQCTALSIDVCEFMEAAREKMGIRFDTDE